MRSQFNSDASRDLGARLRLIRETKGRSLRQIADRCGVGRSTLSRWERGEVLPEARDLEALLDALHVQGDDRRPVTRLLSAINTPERAQVRGRRRLLRAARLRRNLSLGAAADLVGVTKATLSRWETGERWPGRERLAEAARALGATDDEVSAIGSEVPLLDLEGCPVETLEERVHELKRSIPLVCEPERDLEFIGIDSRLANRDEADTKRLRLELRTAYIEWLGWWYRDAEAGNMAERLLPALRQDPHAAVWGRVLRACTNFLTELKNDHAAAFDLLSEATPILKGTPSEGFVMRELASLMLWMGDHEQAREQIRRAREAPAGEEPREVHLYCCSNVEATSWSSEGKHDQAIRCLPAWWEGANHYLRYSSARGHAKVLQLAGEKDAAHQQLSLALSDALTLGVPHFVRGLRKTLANDFGA